jgi:single-strand DNA-binding protein
MYAQITVVGNLGRDPEIRHLPNGATAANFSVAVNEQWLDRQSGERMQKTNWFNIVAYQQGETGLITSLIAKYLKQGQLVMIVGTPQNRKWIDQSGADRYSFEVKLGPQSTIKMLGGRPNGERRGEDTESYEGGVRRPAGDAEHGADGERAGSETPEQRAARIGRQMADEDIPF